jgi:polar amino acid transport system permease protein
VDTEHREPPEGPPPAGPLAPDALTGLTHHEAPISAAVTQVTGWRESAAQASQRVPFRVKLAVVWLVIFGLLSLMFSLLNFDVAWMKDHFGFIIKGLPFTLILAVASIVLAIVLALLGALGRLSKNPVAQGITGFYTSFFRGTPLIVQLFLWYFGVAQIGITLVQKGYSWGNLLILDAFVAAILGLGFNYGAYMTEIFRAGIQSVSHGQMEAAYALGMSYRQVMRRVVLPQAVRVIIPPTGNEFIAMLKDTALVSFLGTSLSTLEVFRRAGLAGKRDFRYLEALILAAAIYWALTSIFSYFQGRLERRLSKGYVREGSHVVPH